MGREVVKRAFKFRFYPTGEQAAELSRTFGCVRLVYNKALEARTTAWVQQSRRIGYQAAGLAVIACGAGVRPQGKPPGGHSAMKQETPPATVGLPALEGGEDVN
jgi:transposase